MTLAEIKRLVEKEFKIDTSEIEAEYNCVCFRSWDWRLYCDRDGEEDDDYPNFVGCELVEKLVGPDCEVRDVEKNWFTVSLNK